MTPADSHSNAPQVIADALECELETLIQVVETLDIEHEALMGSDADRLEQAVAAKQNAIAAHIAARHHREALGLKEALAEQIESHPGFVNGLQARALEVVAELRELGQTSRDANQRNGMLIAGLRERTRSALELLRPDAANIKLYGQGGSAEDTMGSRLLGSA